MLITRAARRLMCELGAEGALEVALKGGLRCDIMLADSAGAITIIEVKSSLEDFRADAKWRGYLAWCDRFFFAVDMDFPLDTLPVDVGVIRTDGLEAAVLRDAVVTPLSAARRKAMLIKLARAASARLRRLQDPGASEHG